LLFCDSFHWPHAECAHVDCVVRSDGRAINIPVPGSPPALSPSGPRPVSRADTVRHTVAAAPGIDRAEIKFALHTIFQIMVVEYYECVSLKSGVDVAFLGIYRQSWLGGRHKFAAVPGGESVLLAAQMLRIARLLGMVTNIIVGLNCNDKRVQGEVETPTVTCPICREQVSLADKDAHATTCLAALIKAHDQADDAVAISEGDYSSIQ
jgi:hypothetical protein